MSDPRLVFNECPIWGAIGQHSEKPMKNFFLFTTKGFLLVCFLAMAIGSYAQDQYCYRLKHNAKGVAVVDGASFYYGSAGVFNARNGKLCNVKGISHFALDPNGKTFAIATASTKKFTIEVYSLWKADCMFAQTDLNAQALCFDYKGGSLLAADHGGNVHILNPINLTEKGVITTNSDIFGMVCGRLDQVATAHKTNVEIYDIRARKIVTIIETSSTAISMAYSDDGKYLAIACRNGLLQLYNTETYKLSKETTIQNQIRTCVFSPDSNYLVVANDTDNIQVLSVVSDSVSSVSNLGISNIEFVGFASMGNQAKKYLVCANQNEIIYKDIATIEALR